MKLLAIDASTEACSVALQHNETLISRHEIAPRGHAQRILPMVDEVLSEAGLSLTMLDGIAFDRGPGSFTGVRVGTSVTQGLAFGADLPVIPVSSLAAIAQGVWRERSEEQILVVIDARMEEVYWGFFQLENGVMCITDEERISRPESVSVDIKGNWFGAGSGWQTYLTVLSERTPENCTGIDSERLPHAQDILTLATSYYANGQYVSPEMALPTYLRNEVAKKQSGL